MKIDDFAPNLSFFFSNGMDPEYTVLGRVARRILTRLGTSLLVLWGAVTVSFVALHLTPGKIIDILIGTSPVTPAVRAQIISDYGLDRPLLARYAAWATDALQGDLGYSRSFSRPVLEVVGPRMVFVTGDVDLTGDDTESHVAVRLRALEAKFCASPAVAGAVLSLSAPDEPGLEP